MAFSHIVITRPREESAELATRLASHPAEVVTLPAYEFRISTPFPELVALLAEAGGGGGRPLVIFTSPRAVEFGLRQLPRGILQRCRVAAIGPTTSRMLQDAGVSVALQSGQGHTSEDLLGIIPACEKSAVALAREAFILSAPGGRTALAEGLRAKGYRPHMLLVYERRPADIEADALDALRLASRVLSVWTSAEAINALAQRLPGDCWKRLCAGEWLVISERLARVGRSFHPAGVHIAPGPTNADLAAAILELAPQDAESRGIR